MNDYKEVGFAEAVGCLLCGALVARDSKKLHSDFYHLAPTGSKVFPDRCTECEAYIYDDETHTCRV